MSVQLVVRSILKFSFIVHKTLVNYSHETDLIQVMDGQQLTKKFVTHLSSSTSSLTSVGLRDMESGELGGGGGGIGSTEGLAGGGGLGIAEVDEGGSGGGEMAESSIHDATWQEIIDKE